MINTRSGLETGSKSGFDIKMHTIRRLDQIVLIASFIGFSWLMMQAVHELGHVLGALVSGGEIVRVVLHPCTISRTDVFPNPHPLFEVWSGPIIGARFPLLVYLLAAGLRSPGLYLFRFFAGFCLIANGAYIGSGALTKIADAAQLLMYGSPRWLLILFGVISVAFGLFLWNGLGPSFGLGPSRGMVSRTAVIASAFLLTALVGIEIGIGSH